MNADPLGWFQGMAASITLPKQPGREAISAILIDIKADLHGIGASIPRQTVLNASKTNAGLNGHDGRRDKVWVVLRRVF